MLADVDGRIACSTRPRIAHRSIRHAVGVLRLRQFQVSNRSLRAIGSPSTIVHCESVRPRRRVRLVDRCSCILRYSRFRIDNFGVIYGLHVNTFDPPLAGVDENLPRLTRLIRVRLCPFACLAVITSCVHRLTFPFLRSIQILTSVVFFSATLSVSCRCADMRRSCRIRDTCRCHDTPLHAESDLPSKAARLARLAYFLR